MDDQILEKEHIVNICGMPPMRCDRYISQVWGICSRSQVHTHVRGLCIDNVPSKLNRKVCRGQRLRFQWNEIRVEKILPEDISFDILYENDDVWVINKPAGLVVHSGVGHQDGTLVNALVFRFESLLQRFQDGARAGIVHRLDGDTSGVIICAKHVEAYEFLSQQFKKRTVSKYYLALCSCSGSVLERGIIQNYIFRSPLQRKQFMCDLDECHGKFSVTEYVTLKKRGKSSLVLLKPYTGRTHQLRVHMKSRGLPILGDSIYHKNCTFLSLGLMLHSWKLRIVLPKTWESKLFTAPLPLRFRECWIREQDFEGLQNRIKA